MQEIITNLQYEQLITLMAPPGWGKTYKILSAIKKTKRKTVFIFPLRALCNEVYVSALKKNILTLNIRKSLDYANVKAIKPTLIITTPECLNESICEELAQEYLFIWDEAHLIKAWGMSFRPKLLEIFEVMMMLSPPIIFLSATMSAQTLAYFSQSSENCYKDIYQIDFGNLKLKNYPFKIFYYPVNKTWLLDDIYFSKRKNTSVIFCRYREEVKQFSLLLEKRGFSVLSCVGGKTDEFTQKLAQIQSVDFIVATCVLGHGVNLPHIEKVYFLYRVEGLEYYLQMLGRGGRDGSPFELHTLNHHYFSHKQLLLAIGQTFLKRIRNKANYFLYYFNENRRHCS